MSKKVSGWPLIAPKEVDTSITGDQVLDALAADVEVSDNGKVLTAVYGGLEGEETGGVMWAEPSGGSTYYVNTVEGSALDKNFAEINAAYESGKHIVVVSYQAEANESFTVLLQPLVVITNANGYMVACYDFTQSTMVMYSSETETGTLVKVTNP